MLIKLLSIEHQKQVCCSSYGSRHLTKPAWELVQGPNLHRNKCVAVLLHNYRSMGSSQHIIAEMLCNAANLDCEDLVAKAYHCCEPMRIGWWPPVHTPVDLGCNATQTAQHIPHKCIVTEPCFVKE